MNESGPYMNESDPGDRMTKKGLKESKVTTYSNKMHLLFRWLNHTNSKTKSALLRAILY